MGKEETFMKKLTNIIVLVVILGLMLGAYFYAKAHPKSDSSKSDSTTTTSSEQSIDIWKIDNDKASKIIINSNKGELTLEKKDNSWTVPAISYKLIETVISNISSNALEMKGTLVEKDAKELEKYGLKDSKFSLKVVLTDKSEKVLYLGEKTVDESYYYAKTSDSNTVYTIAATTVDSFSVSDNDLRDKTITKIDSSTLAYIKIIKDGKTIELKKNNNQTSEEAQYSVNTWNMIKPYTRVMGVDDTKLQALTSAVNSLSVNDIVSDNPSDLDKYGLRNPAIEVILKDDKNTLHFFVGSKKDEYTVYFKVEGSNTIYTISKTSVDPFDLKAFEVVSKLIALPNIDSVDKLVINENGAEHTAILTRQTKKAEKEGEKDTVTTAYSLDNKTIAEDKFKDLYQQIIGLTVDSEIDKKVQNKPEIRLTYYLNKGEDKNLEIEFAPYNNLFYAAYVNGKCDFVISKDKVTNMLKAVREAK